MKMPPEASKVISLLVNSDLIQISDSIAMFSKPVLVSSSSFLAAKQWEALMLSSSFVGTSSKFTTSSCNLNLKPRMESFQVSASVDTNNNMPLTGVVFQPFEEVKKEVLDIPVAPQVSLARQKFSRDCEAAINEQIKWVAGYIVLSSFLPRQLVIYLCFLAPFAVLNTMSLMCTTPCMRISIEIILLSEAWQSNYLNPDLFPLI